MRYATSELSETHVAKKGAAKIAEAKRPELQSFFDDKVWGQDASEIKGPSKVRRAKCLRNSDGSYRAKARLSIVGFRGPDARTGKLAKAPPLLWHA